MTRPRITTVVSAALASAAAFFVITRSGLAGTLGGAAVASMVYTGTSHWAGQGIAHLARLWLKRRDSTAPATVEPGGAAETTPAATPPWRPGRVARSWGPVALGVVALAVSGYSLVTGSPLERVIVQERIIEKPVVQHQVVVQKEIVTVTVTVPASEGLQTTTTVAPSTTTTTTPTTTTTTGVSPSPTTTTESSPTTTTTTAVPAAGN